MFCASDVRDGGVVACNLVAGSHDRLPGYRHLGESLISPMLPILFGHGFVVARVCCRSAAGGVGL